MMVSQMACHDPDGVQHGLAGRTNCEERQASAMERMRMMTSQVSQRRSVGKSVLQKIEISVQSRMAQSSCSLDSIE
jgi:hypothetical protein